MDTGLVPELHQLQHPVLWVEGGTVMGYRGLTGVFNGVPTQTQDETPAPRHTRSLQNSWNWIQSVSPQLCHRPTMVIVQLSCCKRVKVDPAPTDSHKTPFDLKFYESYLLFAFLQYQEIPLGNRASLPAFAQTSNKMVPVSKSLQSLQQVENEERQLLQKSAVFSKI